MPPIFDTSVLIEISRGSDAARKALARYSRERVHLTVINKYEFSRGINSANISEHRRSQLLEFLSQFTVYEFTDRTTSFCVKAYTELKAQGVLINELDIIIIGICMENDETLITNDKDFEKAGSILDVKVELLSG